VDRAVANLIRFGEYEIDLRAGEIRKNGVRVHLQEQPFQVLLTLLQQPGEVVTRDDLRSHVWPKDTFVDFDHALNTAIKKIRCALGDNAGVPRYVETIPRRGYRFIASVESVGDESGVNTTDVLKPERPRMDAWKRRWWAAVSGATVITLLIVVAYISWRSSRAQAFTGITLAVLPFQDLSSDRNQKYLCEGVSEELIIQLARLDPGSLKILEPSAADSRMGKRAPAELGRGLHPDYILTGSVRREGNRARVGAQLIRISDQSHIWGNEFDREVNDVLAFQSEVAGQIVKEVKPALVPAALPQSR
jgi:TolB-like protein/DNA-binding winged helix-turn-helix (wHTH) protein